VALFALPARFEFAERIEDVRRTRRFPAVMRSAWAVVNPGRDHGLPHYLRRLFSLGLFGHPAVKADMSLQRGSYEAILRCLVLS